MSLEPGATLGDYKVVEILGAGGMGRVYRVQNQITNRMEALKVLLPDLHEHAELAERFMREIQVQASLVHPNIAALHTALRIDNQLVMMMELVEGETLERKLRAGPMSVEQCIDCAAQLLGALAYAHGRNIVHRDIKPGNAIVTPSGTAKLMDFGLAAAISGGDKRLTKTGTLLGSLFYMSPEQVRGEIPTQRSDIYSFGLMLYEMLTGVRGIQGDSEYSVMTAHLTTMPEPPVSRNPAIPSELSSVVLRAVAKDPAKRFQTAEAFRTALHEYSRMTETRTLIARPPMPMGAFSASTTGLRKPSTLIAASAAGVLAAGLGLYWFLPERTQTLSASVDGPAAVAPAPASPPETSPAPAPSPEPKAVASAPAAKTESPAKTAIAPVKTSPKQSDSPVTRPAATPAVTPVATAIPPPAEPVARTEPAVAKSVIAEAPPPAAVVAAPSPPPAPKAVEKTPQQVQAEEWESARASRDVGRLQEFRRKYPNTPLAQQALMLIADLEWDRVKKTDAKALRDYQTQFTASAHAPEALAAAERLEHDAARRDIADVLKRYEAAYAARDIRQVRALRPTASADASAKIEAFFKVTRSATLTLQMTGEPVITGDRAMVQCRYSLAAQMTDGSRQNPAANTATVRLSRTRGAWLIDDIEIK